MKDVVYVIPKARTNTLYTYEDNVPMAEHIKNFHVPMQVKNDSRLLNEALDIYNSWMDKLDAN